MIKICITIEGTNGLTWPLWHQLSKTVEAVGFSGLYRSDHLVGNEPLDRPSLELWVSLTLLAKNSNNIEFGPLVTPMSFRHPVLTAKMAADIDRLSKGRLVLGIGAGGWEREHRMFGFDLLDPTQRFKRFQEGVQVLDLLLRGSTPADFTGEFFNLHQATIMPGAYMPQGPTLLIGGLGKKYTLPLVAKYGNEWNGPYITIARFRELNAYLDSLIEGHNRNKSDVTRSILTGCLYSENKNHLSELEKQWVPEGLTADQNDSVIKGGAEEIIEQIGKLEESGVEKIMLVWYDLTDLKGLENMGRYILPHFQT